VKWPDVEKKIEAANPSGDRPMMQVEQQLYEVSHAEVGGWPAKAHKGSVFVKDQRGTEAAAPSEAA
jgi:hypothetical protein